MMEITPPVIYLLLKILIQTIPSMFHAVAENPIIIFIMMGIVGIFILAVLHKENKGSLQKYYKDYTCRSCGRQLKLGVRILGKSKCPHCGNKDLEPNHIERR